MADEIRINKYLSDAGICSRREADKAGEEGRVLVNGVPVVWEGCHTFSGSWGYYRDEESWKSVPQLLMMLIDCVSMGGNLQMISKYIFIVTPKTVELSGDFQDIVALSEDSGLSSISFSL